MYSEWQYLWFNITVGVCSSESFVLHQTYDGKGQ